MAAGQEPDEDIPAFPASGYCYSCLPAAAVTGLVTALGLVHGFLNGAALREGAGTLGLIGITTMLFIVVTLASALVVSFGKPWTRNAVRVVGSWIAAIRLLMFGWAMR